MPKKKRSLETIRVGVEIECEFSNTTDSEKLIEKHRIIPGWEISYDGSLDNGAEYKPKGRNKLYFTKDGIDQLKEILGLLKAHKATVSQRCGFHVHVDMSQFSNQEVANIIKAFVYKQNAIYKEFKVLRHREKNHCSKISKKALKYITAGAIEKLRRNEDVGNVLDSSNYFNERNFGCNADALTRHGSLEFRYANGTIQINKIKKVIKYCIMFCLENAKGK